MSNDKKESKAGKVIATALVILALIAVAILVLKQDDCFPDPEPEPVPCKGSHCPVKEEATTGEVVKAVDGVAGESTEGDAVPSK